MQLADNAALAAAVAAPNRRVFWAVAVDWNGDGQYAHPWSDVTDWVVDVEVDRGLGGGVAAEASLVSGSAGASAKVTLAGTVDGQSLAAAMSPYNTSAIVTGQLLGREAVVFLGMMTTEGVVRVPQITGPIRAVNYKSGAVELVVSDPSDRLRAPITLPVATILNKPRLTQAQYPAHIRTQWVVDYILRWNGYGASLHPYTLCSTTLHGGHVAEVGASLPLELGDGIAPALASADDWWVDGPHGFKAPRGSWSANAPFTSSVVESPRILSFPSGIGVACWYKGGVGHQAAGADVVPWLSQLMFGPSSSAQDRAGIWINRNGLVGLQMGNASFPMTALQAAAGNALGWHYVAVHFAVPASGPVAWTARFDNYYQTGTLTRPTFSADQWTYALAQTRHAVPVSDVSWWSFPTPPDPAVSAQWPGLTYTGDDHGPIDLGVNRLSWLPTRVGADSWDLLQEVVAAEAGTVGFAEDGLPYFRDRTTLTAETSTVERTVTSMRELLSLDVGLSSDTVRNTAEVQTVSAALTNLPVATFSSVAEDMFDTPANSTRDYYVWVDPDSVPFVRQGNVGYFNAAQWDQYDAIGDGIVWGFCMVRADTPTVEVDAPSVGVVVSSASAGPRRMWVRIVNPTTYPVRCATPNGRPALRLNGLPILKAEPIITKVNRQSSIDIYGPRTLDIGGGDWDQDQGSRAMLAVSLLEELRRPVPVLPAIEVVGDPRVQLGDTLAIQDPGRMGAQILASVVDLKRTLQPGTGLRDQYGVRPILPDDGVEDEDPELPDVDAPVDPGTGDPGTPGARPYFAAAEWHWGEVPASPVLDSQSAQIVNLLRQGGHVLNCVRFGNTLRGPSGITTSTPRYTVAAEYASDWGPAFPSGATIPIPNGTENFLAPGDGDRDAHVAVADPTTNKVYSMWIAEKSGGTWSCGWGGTADLNGEGRETIGGSTGSGISRYACVIRVAELVAGVIPHALFFSTDMARPSTFKYPATKTDGSNDSGQPYTIWEGARVQLDPSLNPDAYGLNKAEKAIFVALQKYGAYCGDNGGTRMAFLSELADDWTGNADNPGAKYASAGITSDYYSLSKIPWASLRLLRNWNGSA